jgi:hypothetical protein
VATAALTALFAGLSVGCGGGEETPTVSFEKPEGYQEPGTPAKLEDVFKSQRKDRDDDGPVKPGAKSRR